MADLREDVKTPDLRESLMMLVMVGSTVSKHSRRNDIGALGAFDPIPISLVYSQ